MNLVLRIVLIIGAFIALSIVISTVRKQRITIASSVYWVVCAVLVVLFAVFPGIPSFFSRLLGFLSPSNFVFCIIIMLMLVKLFTLSCEVSRLGNKLDNLAEEEALAEKRREDEKDER